MESDYDGDGNSNSSCRTARKTTAKHSQNTSAPSFIHASTHSPLRTPSFRHIHPRTHSTVRNLLLGITNPVRPLRSPPSPSPSPSAFIPTQKISSPDPSPSSFGKKDPPSGVTANVPPHLASHRIASPSPSPSHRTGMFLFLWIDPATGTARYECMPPIGGCVTWYHKFFIYRVGLQVAA